jgi:hypothetical protein
MEQGWWTLERVLRREHKIRPGGNNDFTYSEPDGIAGDPATNDQVLALCRPVSPQSAWWWVASVS